jgi:hypothetical protein
MLACLLAIVALGYHWRDRPTLRAGVGLGGVMGFGALSMTYVIPAALCWVMAVSLSGSGWLAWDRRHFKISWTLPVLVATGASVLMLLWPPGVRHLMVIKDFLAYLHYPSHTTLLGDAIFEVAPRSAVISWLANLDSPILAVSSLIILAAVWRGYRSGRVTSTHIYLTVFLVFFLVTALAAHLAGARNLLQCIGVMCLASGALFDEALGDNPKLIRIGSVAIVLLAALNLIWLSSSSSYRPYFAAGGYRSLLQEDGGRIHERAKAIVYGLPILNFYAHQSGTPIGWDAREMPWTTRADAPLPDDVKYVLIPEFVFKSMPPEQPMRRIVAQHWKVVWSNKTHDAWELRLYEKPQPIP